MIIDFHTHIFPDRVRDDRRLFFDDEPAFEAIYQKEGARISGAGGLLDNMDNEGVEKSVVFGFPWKKADNFRSNNDYVIESVLKHPDRLIGFCTLDILSPYPAKEVERCLEAGMAGVGELAVYDADFTGDVIERLRETMALCAERGVPVLIHANEPVGHAYPGKQPMTLRGVYGLIRAFPLNRIVLAHWGGGVFFYALMKKEVKAALSNVWFDTAASPFLYRPDIYRISGEISGFDRIIFGSDYPLLKPGRYMRELDAAGISREAVKRITFENAMEVLGIKLDPIP